MKRKKLSSYLLRMLAFLAGMVMLSFGFCLNESSDMGLAPVMAAVRSVSEIFALNFDLLFFIINSLFVVVQIVIHLLNEKYKYTLIDLIQIPFAMIFLRLVYIFDELLNGIMEAYALDTFQGIPVRTGMVCAAILLEGVGTAMMLCSKGIPLSCDGAVKAISEQAGKGLGKVKCSIDLICFAAAVAINMMFTDKFVGVGIGTLASAVFVGIFVGIIVSLYNKISAKNELKNTKEKKSVKAEEKSSDKTYSESVKTLISPERRSVLIKDTTCEERRQIVADSLGCDGDSYEAMCEGIGGTGITYQPYIDGIKELWEINEAAAYSEPEQYDEQNSTDEPTSFPTVMFETYKPENDENYPAIKHRSVLIKDTTREERMCIVNSSLGGNGDSYEAMCEGIGNTGNMYQPYIDGKKELWEINEENSNFYLSE